MGDAQQSLRVLTWNVHGCIGRGGRHDMERVGDGVRLIAPDLAAFQEVDSRRTPGRSAEIQNYLCETVGEHGHGAWSLSSADGHYGQMLASRYPLDHRKVHDISVPGREPRKVMEARLRLPHQSMRVLATHLGLWRGERRRQLADLREIVKADLSLPILLLGDFNEWRRGRHGRNGLFDLFEAWTTQASFPSRLPVLALDRIFCRPGSLLRKSWVARDMHLASDHLPVVAELSLDRL